MPRLCTAGEQLRGEIDRRYSRRDRSSDGWVGDSAHSSRKSDHNPNARGDVRALDVDKDGLPAGTIVEHLRKLGRSGDRRLLGGYIIWRGRICGTHTGWAWHEYTGANGHYAHFHVSFADARADYERPGSWGIFQPTPPAPNGTTPKGDRVLGLTNPLMVGQDVKNVQNHLRRLGNKIPADGVYGRTTADVVAVYKRNRKISERGWGADCWAQARKEIAAR